MSKTAYLEDKLLRLIFCNEDWRGPDGYPAVSGSAQSGSLWLSLHVNEPPDPTFTTTTTTFEAVYTGYARGKIPRRSSSWTITTGSGPTTMTNAIPITCGSTRTNFAATVRVSYFAITTGNTNTSSTYVLYKGLLIPPIDIVSGSVAPVIDIGSLIIKEDL